MLTIPDIHGVFDRRGERVYAGEPVNQREHALQAATLAMEDDAPDPLIVAALLHDLGHMLTDEPQRPGREIDDLHQFFVLPFLRGLFPQTVLDTICLHVDAKRYLCFSDEGYYSNLSEDSKTSLRLQGGAYGKENAQKFLLRPCAADAIRLRRWDDWAKEPGKVTPPLEFFDEVMERVRTKYKMVMHS